MSLNCLTCQALQRSDSEKECCGTTEKLHRRLICCKNKLERSWSGNFSPPPYEQIGRSGSIKKKIMKKEHRRLAGPGAVSFSGEPRLVRSSGMRRDWSFEDLDHKKLLQNSNNNKNRQDLVTRN